MTASAIYEGTIRHRRFAVRPREFSHRVALAYLDLEELDGLLGGRLVADRPRLVRFRRADYLGEPSISLADAVRTQVERQTGRAPTGPIRLLTQLRSFGHCFNPVSFYYCFTPQDQLEAVVAEVTSTPWGERHAYVVGRTGEGPVLDASIPKKLHVSPFMAMEQRYLWRIAAPGPTLSVHIESHEQGRRAFDATLALRRSPLTRAGLGRVTARTRGCRVTTTTISREQYEYARAQVRAAGVADRVTVLCEDYRDLRGSYDKLVSIEMIEAVGWRDFDTFFARCSDLLSGDGSMLLQGIVIDDRAYAVEKASRSFIRTHIFPNGCLPSLEVIAHCVARHTDMRTVTTRDLTPHYAETLVRWRANFEAATTRLRDIGYDERFRRLWRMYLAYCEAGFTERRIGVVQMHLAKPLARPVAGQLPDGDTSRHLRPPYLTRTRTRRTPCGAPSNTAAKPSANPRPAHPSIGAIRGEPRLSPAAKRHLIGLVSELHGAS